MGLGAVYLRLHHKYGHGLRVAWYRDIVRPRILETPPVKDLLDGRCEIHAFTSQQDWLNLVWALKSFYKYSNHRYRLCIHEDGSLVTETINQLVRHFPDARIITRIDADKLLYVILANYPRVLEFRKKNLLAPKLVDFIAYSQSDRMLVFDSDLLFFSEPTVLLSRIETGEYRLNTFNSDINTAYTVDTDEVERLMNFKVMPRFNSGLGLVHKNSIRYDWIEEFLALPGITNGHFWRIEQTLYALCSSRFGTEHLPDEYTLYLQKGIGNRPFRHYVGAIRHLMYSEGIASLDRNKFLENLRF